MAGHAASNAHLGGLLSTCSQGVLNMLACGAHWLTAGRSLCMSRWLASSSKPARNDNGVDVSVPVSVPHQFSACCCEAACWARADGQVAGTQVELDEWAEVGNERHGQTRTPRGQMRCILTQLADLDGPMDPLSMQRRTMSN